MELPKGAKIITQGGEIILAYGEATGHAHRVRGDAGLIEYNNRRFLVVNGEPTVLDHEEHGPIALKKGIYDVSLQRQWDFTRQVVENIAD